MQINLNRVKHVSGTTVVKTGAICTLLNLSHIIHQTVSIRETPAWGPLLNFQFWAVWCPVMKFVFDPHFRNLLFLGQSFALHSVVLWLEFFLRMKQDEEGFYTEGFYTSLCLLIHTNVFVVALNCLPFLSLPLARGVWEQKGFVWAESFCLTVSLRKKQLQSFLDLAASALSCHT